MTLARTRSCAVVGLEGSIVEVEVDIAPGLPAFTIVGLPDTAVQEARERVRAAIRNSGFEFPQRRITVSLAPADLKKNGTSYDLPNRCRHIDRLRTGGISVLVGRSRISRRALTRRSGAAYAGCASNDGPCA